MKDWEARMNAHTRTLFRRFTELIGACGPYHLAPAKTRIAILARVRFAGVTSISERSITISFALPKRRRSPRFASVTEVAPGWWAHRMKITDATEFDADVRAWVRDSYRLMGMQERLAFRRRAPGDPRAQ
jgi:hypothetical protein